MFSFVNFHVKQRPERIVVTKETDGQTSLNIVLEYHYLILNKYEVTLITALPSDDFLLSDGQYQLILHSNETSVLYRKQLTKTGLVSSYSI